MELKHQLHKDIYEVLHKGGVGGVTILDFLYWQQSPRIAGCSHERAAKSCELEEFQKWASDSNVSATDRLLIQCAMAELREAQAPASPVRRAAQRVVTGAQQPHVIDLTSPDLRDHGAPLHKLSPEDRVNVVLPGSTFVANTLALQEELGPFSAVSDGLGGDLTITINEMPSRVSV